MRDSLADWGRRQPERYAHESRVLRVPPHRVGEPFRPGRLEWPSGSRYQYTDSGHELILFEHAINENLCNAVGRGPAEFALVVESPLIVLGYRFGTVVPWSTAPFSWHMQPAAVRGRLPRELPGARALIGITLVGARDGIVHAQRSVTLAPEFSDSLHTAILAQANRPFDPHEYVRAVGTLYLSNPRASTMLRRAVSRAAGNS
jgi:hypothetical protein